MPFFCVGEDEDFGMSAAEESRGTEAHSSWDNGETLKEGNAVAELRVLQHGTDVTSANGVNSKVPSTVVSGNNSRKEPAFVVTEPGIGRQEEYCVSSQPEAFQESQRDRDYDENDMGFSADGHCRNDEACSVFLEQHRFQPFGCGEDPSLPKEQDSMTQEAPAISPHSRALQHPLSVTRIPRTSIAEGETGKCAKRKAKKVSFSPAKYVEDLPDLEKGLEDDADVKADAVKASTTTTKTTRTVAEDRSEHMCRVCHLHAEGSGDTDLIYLGCDCKEDMGLAHRHCAEAWFKIRGNRVCEICGENAKNIVGSVDAEFMESWNERGTTAMDNGEPGRWRTRPLCSILLGFMIVAFILPWFFRISMF